MFCPKCGESDQKEQTYCRRCGSFLAEFGKIKRSERPVDENFNATIVLSILTGVSSLVLAIILYATFLGGEKTPTIIYIVAGFLTAMFAWQVQSLLRTLQLKKQYKRQSRTNGQEADTSSNAPVLESKPTNELLPEADHDDVVPASVTENTTRSLREEVKRLAEP